MASGMCEICANRSAETDIPVCSTVYCTAIYAYLRYISEKNENYWNDQYDQQDSVNIVDGFNN